MSISDHAHDRIVLPPGLEWERVRALLAGGLGDRVFRLTVTLRGRRAVLEGAVFSEEVKADIGHLVVLNTFVDGIDNLLEVTSPLYSAGDDFDAPPQPATLPETSTVTRYPDIRTTEGTPLAGDSIDIVADLLVSASKTTEAEPMELGFRSDQPHLDIDVEIHSSQLDIPEAQRFAIIRVRRDGPSMPALFSGRVREDAVEIEVRLIFSFAGRYSGSATRTIPVGRAPEINGEERSYTVGGSGLSVDRSARPPSLTVRIFNNGSADGNCVWSFDTAPHLRHLGVSNRVCTSVLGQSPKDYFTTKFRQCPILPAGTHQGTLRGLGETIWGAVPQQFSEIYRLVRGAEGPEFPIQILTDEPHVPWELMFVGSAASDVEGHLALMHPVARWSLNENAAPASYRFGRRVSFVPQYARGATLPAAEAEGQWLATEVDAERGAPDFASFMGLLTGTSGHAVQLVHFAGHGAAEGAPNEIGLRMQDHWVPVEQINGSVRLGKRDAPLFVLNACQVGNADRALGAVTGWPAALARQGFGGVVAPLWSIQDESAASFVRSLLTGILKEGLSIGAASLAAKKANAAASPSAYAYVMYGDVMAIAETSPTPR
ncbi:CHAT domain-containing protein [Devosia sp. ZW T5_3]|uniref:CHAT domain-containing protein n=1 Tax=Devosia sp. ZW T5_3 TaxID=3378085 RepID=UPI003855122C